MKADGIPLARISDHLARAGCEPRPGGPGIVAVATCPKCRKRDHLTLTSGESGPVVACKAGCAPESIMEALGLSVPKTAPATRAKPPDTSPAAPPTDKPSRPGRTLVVERASAIKPEAVRWLWPGRIPLGKVTVLEGHAGLGKTLAALDIAARVSMGRAMPLQSEPPCEGARDVLILSYEDDPRDTIRPRLDAAGANLERVHIIKGARTVEDGDCPVVLPDDLTALEAEIRKYQAGLVLVDPFMAALSGKIDAHRDQDVRRVLSRMRDLAEATGAAFLLIRHLRKASVSSAVLAGQGSVGIGAAARSVYLVAKDRNDPEKARILAPVKTNVARSTKALRFRLAYRTTEGIEAPFIEWMGECDETADELTAAPPEAEERGAVAAAMAFLREELAGGPRAVPDLKDTAKAAGMGWRTIERASTRLGVEKSKSGFGGGWSWRLKTANGAELAAFAKTAKTDGAQLAETTPKTAKAPEDRQAASLADLGGVVESADLGESQDLSESAEQSWVDDLEESDHGR